VSAAERLRKVAAEMREYAEAATPGPWWAEGVWWEHWTDAEGRRCHTPWPTVGHSTTGADLIAKVATTEETARHIAAWSPPVALAVADWLDVCAETIEGIAYDGPGQPGSPLAAALAVCDAWEQGR
jgi:hypothetical protein